MRKITMLIISIFLIVPVISLTQEVLIVQIHGNVKIRRGVSEEWISARRNMFLRRVDSIISEGNSWVELRIDENEIFKLTQEAILDICDLKRISEDELFLMLMDQKLSRCGKEEKELKVSDVSIPRGKVGIEMKHGQNKIDQKIFSLRLFNGIKSLYDNGYFTNTIAGLKKFLTRKTYREGDHGDDAQLYLAKSFEALKWYGRAIAAYQDQTRLYPKSNLINESQRSIERLEKIQNK